MEATKQRSHTVTTKTSIYETKPYTNTWNGREATLVVFAATKNAATRCGERVTAHFWTDGELTIAHIKGDGRRADFQRFDEASIPAGTIEDARAWASEKLA